MGNLLFDSFQLLRVYSSILDPQPVVVVVVARDFLYQYIRQIFPVFFPSRGVSIFFSQMGAKSKIPSLFDGLSTRGLSGP